MNLLNTILIPFLLLRAKSESRKRANFPLGYKNKRGNKLHLMLNGIREDSYVAPHVQPDKNVVETLTCLYGKAYIVFFDTKGEVKNVTLVSGKNKDRVTINPGIYHTVVTLKPSVFYEEMQQPKGRLYDPKKDKLFASWAPSENSNKQIVNKYRKSLLSKCDEFYLTPRERTIGLYGGNWWSDIFSHWKFWEEPYEVVDRMLPDDGLIIELGCGEGFLTNYLELSKPKRKIIGYEIVPERLALAKKGIKNTSYFVADVVKKPFPKADVFILFHVLHHLPGREAQVKVLEKVKKALKKGGKLVIVDVHVRPTIKYLAAWVFDHFFVPWVFESRFFTRAYFRTEGQWKALLKDLGFKVKSKEETAGRPFPNIIFDCSL